MTLVVYHPFSNQVFRENKSPCNWSEKDNVWKEPGFLRENMHFEKFGQWYATTQYNSPPYVLFFDSFISIHEVKYLIHYANYQLDDWNTSGTYDAAICNGDCQEDVIIKSILRRIELAIGIPNANAENAEFRRFQNGGEKPRGHDYLAKEREQPQGVRIATFYIFLSEQAGDVPTSAAWWSPSIVSLQSSALYPKIGRGLLWVNVLDEDLNAKEDLMEYEFMPSVGSTQYGFNIHFRQRNYKDTRDCQSLS